MNPLAIFAGPYATLAKWGVIAVIALAIGVTGWIKGNAHGTQKLFDYQAKQAQESGKIIVKQGAVTERILTRYLDRVRVLQGATTTIDREVIRYVDSKPLTLACMLDRRWISLHDSAAAGTVPDAAAGIYDSGRALPAVGSVAPGVGR